MGTWFADLLERRGMEVIRTGRRSDLTPTEMAKRCDVVVVSVPIPVMENVIREVGPLVREGGLLMDLASIKKMPVEAMLRTSRAEVVGAHPLFGPDHASEAGLKVAVCPARGERGLNWLVGILKDAGLRATVLSAEKHDRIMGLIQGVNHFSTLALALAISRCGVEMTDISNLSTRTFGQKVDRIRSMLKQSESLFESILMDNASAGEIIDLYLDGVTKLGRMVREKERESFRGLFESLRELFNREG